jgi:hypothetical protein
MKLLEKMKTIKTDKEKNEFIECIQNQVEGIRELLDEILYVEQEQNDFDPEKSSFDLPISELVERYQGIKTIIDISNNLDLFSSMSSQSAA